MAKLSRVIAREHGLQVHFATIRSAHTLIEPHEPRFHDHETACKHAGLQKMEKREERLEIRRFYGSELPMSQICSLPVLHSFEGVTFNKCSVWRFPKPLATQLGMMRRATSEDFPGTEFSTVVVSRT